VATITTVEDDIDHAVVAEAEGPQATEVETSRPDRIDPRANLKAVRSKIEAKVALKALPVDAVRAEES